MRESNTPVQRNRTLARPLSILAVLALACASSPAQAGPRSFSDFLDVQGTYCLDLDGDPATCELVDAPFSNFVAWAGPRPNYDQLAVVDCTGLVARKLNEAGIDLGTVIQGEVNERSLPDGRAEITVKLQARNALTSVTQLNADGSLGEQLMGNFPVKVLSDGAKPAIGSCEMMVRYISPEMGAPMLDLFELAFATPEGYEMRTISIRANGQGVVGDTTNKASLVLSQSGMFGNPSSDSPFGKWPVEVLQVHKLGR